MANLNPGPDLQSFFILLNTHTHTHTHTHTAREQEIMAKIRKQDVPLHRPIHQQF